MSRIRLSQKQINQLFIDGVNQFNNKNFYEAHECWESIWLLSEGFQKKYFQALILLAGAGVHYQKNRLNPAKRLLILAEKRLLESGSCAYQHFNKELLIEIFEYMTEIGPNGLPELIINF